MCASTANSPELTQARKSRDYLAKVFAHRLSLTEVAQSMIQAWISEWFAGSRLQASNSWIGVTQPGGHYTQLIALSDALIKRCMSGEALNYTPGHHQLLIRSGAEVFQPVTEAISVDDIELMLNTLALGVLAGFCERLVEYWNADVPGVARSRWYAVREQLRACLLTARQNPPLTPEQAGWLLGLGNDYQELWAYQADREALDKPHVLRIYQVYAAQDGHGGEWLPLLVLQRQVQGQQITLVYVPAMNLLKLDTPDALGNLLPRYMNHYLPGVPVNWVLREPMCDVFEALAQTLLERQLRTLYRLDWSALPDIGSYENLFITLTSPLAWFDPDYLQQPHEEQLPVWLQQANRADRLVYGQWLERLERSQRVTGGASFLDGLDPIDVYAHKALQRQMRLDHPTQALINPDDYLLTFEHTQGATVGWTQRTSRTLTQWSLENPFATAYARVQISNQTSPGQVPGWITPAYLKQLIERVDVGKHYPALLEHALIADPAESARRRRLFVDQMAIQLPMRALENSLRRRYGFTRAGALVVRAVLQDDPQKRVIDGEVIAARPLAFLIHAGGLAHRADNLFVIGPRDNSQLPHILYRPDQTEAVLQQFPSRQALLDEIARMGSDLQSVVLQRLPEDSRAVFGNGGFLRPHVQRFLQGDEYDVQPSSSPALLSDEPVQGDFLAAVFDDNAQSLWQLAVKQSASNQALRWTLFKNDLWQLFNALLPMIRGPVAVAGWLFQTFRTFRTVLALPAQASREDTANALAELMGSVAGLLLSPVVTLDQRLRLRAIKTVTTGVVSAPEVIPPNHVRQSASTFAWQRSLADITAMDYSWANSRFRLTPQQQAQLETFQWSPQRGERWPERPTIVSADSPVRGGVQVLSDSAVASVENYTLIDGKLYGVRAVEAGWRLFDLRNSQRLGPWLRKNARGAWKVDLGLRLIGGQLKNTAIGQRAQIEQKNLALQQAYNEVSAELTNAERVVIAAENLCEKAHLSAEGLFTDSLRQNARARFLKELEKKEEVQLKKLNVLVQKNANRPVDGFEREHSLQLEDMLKTMRRRMYVLKFNRMQEQFSKVSLDQLTAQLEHEDVAAVQAAYGALTEEARKIGEFQDKMVNLSFWERVFYERLLSIPGYKSYIGELAPSSHGLPLDWRTLQLQTLKQLIWRRQPLPEERDDVSRVKVAIDEAIQSAQSQKTIDEAGVLSVQQRIDGIQAILHEYAGSRAILDEYRAAAPDLIHGDIEVPVEEAILSLEQESRIALAKLLREQERNPQPTTVRTPGAGQRLVRDSKRRYQLGRVRARTPQASEDIVDLISPVDQTVVVSLHQRVGSAEFEAIPEAVAVVPRPIRSLENLKRDARRLLDREPIVQQQARAEALASNVADNVQARLTRQSEAIRAVAEKIRKALPEAPDAVSQALLDELEQVSRRYLEQGRLLRIDMLKRLPPDEDGIAWLHAQDQVLILRIEGRIALKRVDDFLQEYVVKDKQGKVLAYAHFHYTTLTTPDSAYNAGHLKRPEQRFMSFRSLADKTDRDVIAIYYSRISAPMAEQLFFSAKGSVKHRGRRSFW
ncbi:hypothetical protein C4J89_4178 [Pseudomonas sp. R4-35-07]|uniref:hypothetical protein n=1 Tax=Pseudomonas sp. R4-35-07 TaxID=658643 RepID=UPI000F579DD7|nr:hypothetical protein [Pseudomonas sp. R4-35-07]AZF33626.1 hypothetical protein C4J89_4178 [Pseudomonas sp. R4-35-07]